MADTTLTTEQLTTILEISKDIQIRIKANGMPELDEDLAEMIALLEAAAEAPPPEPDPEAARKKKEDADPVKPIIDPARPPEGKVIPKDATLRDLETKKVTLEDKAKPTVKDKEHVKQAVEHTEATLKELKAEQKDRRDNPPVPPKIVPLSEAKEHKATEGKTHTHKSYK